MKALPLLLQHVQATEPQFQCVLTADQMLELRRQILASSEFAWIEPWPVDDGNYHFGGGLKNYLWFRKRQATQGMIYENGQWVIRKTPMTPEQEAALRVIWTQQFIQSGGTGRWAK